MWNTSHKMPLPKIKNPKDSDCHPVALTLIVIKSLEKNLGMAAHQVGAGQTIKTVFSA